MNFFSFNRLIGKTFEKNIKYDQFTSPEEALNHPFLSQRKYHLLSLKMEIILIEIDIRMLPSDIS